MNMDIFKGRWNEVKGSMKQWWGKLTDDDLTYIGGSWDKLVGKLQERYGWSKEEAENEADRRMATEAHH
ncbi:MAG TPA: CsbD family protein [Planctomycetota bacterium]|nr:CsbD family protein [Planctomycetota bacterium]